MAGGGGGAWKLAFADFATAMMAFFLVMWATGQSKPVRESIAQYFEYPTGTKPMDKPPDNMPGWTESPPAPRIFYELNQTQVTGTMVLFDEVSAELNTPACKQLDALIPDLKGTYNKIEIRGHTSGKRIPAGAHFRDTWELSYERCLAVKKYLVAKGIEPELIRLSQDAEYEPYSLQVEDKWQNLNSRVEIYQLSEKTYKHKDRRKESGGMFAEPDPNAPPPEAKDAHGGHGSHGAKEPAKGGHGGHGAPKDAHGGHGSKGAHGAAKDPHGGHGAPKPAHGGHGAPKDAHGATKDSHGGHGAKAPSGHGSPASGHGAKASSGHGAKPPAGHH